MARIGPGINYAADLERIREDYVPATKSQRYHIISQRLEDQNHGPNLLVTSVSAVEALARSLLQHLDGTTKDGLRKAYGRYRYWSAVRLVKEYIERKREDPAVFLEEDNWELFKYAVEFRHLLVHECTYLGYDKSVPLISACQAVLAKLVKLGNVPIRKRGW